MMNRTRPRQALIALIASLALLLTAGCGSPPERLPFETLATAESWRLLYHYNYRGSEADRQRISADQLRMVSALRESVSAKVELVYLDSPEADITVTVEERQRASGYGQVSGLNRREFFWWMRFYNRKGELLAEYNENRQHLMRQVDTQALRDALSEQIERALRGEKVKR